MVEDSSIIEDLKKLTSLYGVSGYEDKVISYIKDKLKPLNNLTIDSLGNIFVHVKKAKNSKEANNKRLLIFAHMDEVGFVVRKIESNGFIRLERVGGIPEKSLLGQKIVIETEAKQFYGVIGTKSHHLTKDDEKYRVLTINELYADFGFKSDKDVYDNGITIGTPVNYSRQFFNNDSIIFSNTIDNRIGCLTLLKLIDEVKDLELNMDLFVLFSVQEEFNLRGILPAIREINPDIAISIDITVATDTPDLRNIADIFLGFGPTISKYSFHGRGTLGGLIPNPKLINYIKKIAIENDIPLQETALIGILTDSSFAQLENNGILMVDMGIPCRYTHAPLEVIDIKDLKLLIKLLKEIILKISIDNPCFTRG